MNFYDWISSYFDEDYWFDDWLKHANDTPNLGSDIILLYEAVRSIKHKSGEIFFSRSRIKLQQSFTENGIGEDTFVKIWNLYMSYVRDEEKYKQRQHLHASREFMTLSQEEREILLEWIISQLRPIRTINTRISSYGLKHVFERNDRGFYVTNDQFKGAMIFVGYEPYEQTERNWIFKISKKSPAFVG